MAKFKDLIKDHQIALIGKDKIFEDTEGYGKQSSKSKDSYPHILKDGSKNLYRKIREGVVEYFEGNDIAFWGGKTISGNILSSQVACLNHLFLIRNDYEAVKQVMQAFLGNKLEIDSMEIVNSEKEKALQAYIAFEMISDIDRMNEKKLTRGNTCTSIDAFAIAKDKKGKRYMLVIEWKLVEDDSGNKAPTDETSTNEKEIERGNTRVGNYCELINKSDLIEGHNKDYHNTPLFKLPFYELMRQTLWAELNKSDFNADDYFHIHVMPKDNPMRNKNYKCCPEKQGVEEGWRSMLTLEGNKRYTVADPHQVVDVLKTYGGGSSEKNDIVELAEYLQQRYYDYKVE